MSYPSGNGLFSPVSRQGRVVFLPQIIFENTANGHPPGLVAHDFDFVRASDKFEEFSVKLLLYHRTVLAPIRKNPDPNLIQPKLAGALERRIRYAELR